MGEMMDNMLHVISGMNNLEKIMTIQLALVNRMIELGGHERTIAVLEHLTEKVKELEILNG